MIAFVRIPAAAWGAFCAVALFIITSAACVFAAEPVVIDESFNSAAIGRNLEILIDADRRYTIDEVSSPNSACGFSPSDSDHPNFGYMHGAVWARFTLDNRTAEAFDLLLELPQPFVDHVEFYTFQGGSAVVRTGDMYPSLAPGAPSQFRLSRTAGTGTASYGWRPHQR